MQRNGPSSRTEEKRGQARALQNHAAMTSLISIVRDLPALLRLPTVTIHLMHEAARMNDPFYLRLVEEFYALTRKRHPKFPLLREMAYGVALCRLPPSQEAYLQAIESSGKRNFKKAQRLGYRFNRIEFNDHLADIAEIHKSANVRQGPVPDEWLKGRVSSCANPVSRTNTHDYVYFGVLRDDRLVAFAGCFVCGEIAMIENLLGHADCLSDGIVPLLLSGMVGELVGRYPSVRYYAYGTYYGGGVSLRRFKKKFGFEPHRVRWVLD
jgi:hypothetical protein